MVPRRGIRIDRYRAGLVLVPCLIFFYELFGISRLAGWDVTRLNLPLKWFDVQSIREGVLPLWNHYLYAGMPHLAESESGLFYPGNILLHLPGDFFYWAGLTYVLHFVLAGLFMDLWLRGRGYDKRACFFGAVLFQTSPFLLFHISSMALMQVAAWLPLLLWIIDRVMQPDYNARTFFVYIRAAILGAVLLFAGNAQMLFFEILFMCFYIAGHVLAYRDGWKRRLGAGLGLILAMGVGVLVLGAVLWMPSREFATLTVREHAGKAFYWLGTWLTPSRLASIFYFPSYGSQSEMVGWASSLAYVGLYPSLLIIFRLMGIRVNWRKDAPVILLAGISLFLAMGMFNPVNHVLIKLPVFSMFRYLGRYAVGGLVGIIGICAACLSERAPGHPSKKELLAALYIIFISLFFFIFNADPSPAILWGAGILIFDCILTWWIIGGKIAESPDKAYSRLFVYLLMHIIVVFPIARIASMPVEKFKESLSFYQKFSRSDGLPPRFLAIDIGRFEDRNLLGFNLFKPQDRLPNLCAGNTSVFFEAQSMDPYTPMMPVEWSEVVRNRTAKGFEDSGEVGVLDSGTVNLLKMLGVDYVITSGRVESIPDFDQLDENLEGSFGPQARMFASRIERPRVWMAGEIKYVECRPDISLNEQILLLRSGAVDFTCQLEGSNNRLKHAGEMKPDELGELINKTRESGFLTGVRDKESIDETRVQLERNGARIFIKARKEGLCVIEISYNPQWEIEVNGEPAETIRANGVFHAVRIPSGGEYEVKMRYRPESFDRGMKISMAGLIAVIVLSIWGAIKRMNEGKR